MLGIGVGLGARFLQDIAPPVPLVSLPQYTGPGDISSGATMWSGLRGYSAAVAATGTQNAVRVRRSSDNTERNLVILPTGALDAATAATFAGGSDLFVKTFYDQTDNGNDWTQPTSGAQPKLVFTGGPSGTLPKLLFSGAQFMSTGTTTIAAVNLFSIVYVNTGGFGVLIGPTDDDINQLWAGPGVNQVTMGNGTFTATATDNAWHAVQAFFNNSGSAGYSFNVDGAATSGGARGAFDDPTVMNMGSYHAGVGVFFSGGVCEFGMWSSNVSANNAAMNSNQRNYWGF